MDFKVLAARLKAQNEGKDAVRKHNYNASLIASVGTGKSKILIDLAEELLEAGKVKTILYVCDNRRLRDSQKEGFPGELKKWGSPELIRAVQLECYQTTYKWVGRKYDLVLGDEVDAAITVEYIKVFLNNTFKYKILVSGTLSAPKEKVLIKIAPIVFRLRGHEAEERGVVNKTEYYTYNYKMYEEECKEYKTLTGKIRQLKSIGVPDNDTTLQFWIRKRKGFLNTLESGAIHTRKVLRYIRNKNPKNRVVIFCERTEQADKVCKYSFHGQNEKDDMLAKFQNGEINEVAVVAKVKRGINMKRTNVGLFESVTGSPTEWEQRAGRLKRLNVDETAVIVFMIPWTKKVDSKTKEVAWKATVVQDWVQRATTNIPNISFKILKL